jgi:gamma-glutamylcyclotransferase (GGCT)/AIG2-like uncharacterized protein YtfP
MSLTAAVPLAPASAASSSSPSSSADEVRHLAVYGTLRDDDDSGALWTRSFLDGVAEASDGLVEGAEMFWSSEGMWPFVLLHPLSPALSEQIDHTLQTADTIVAGHAAAVGDTTSAASISSAAPAASPSAPTAVPSSLAAPSCSIRVRLLRWPDAASFAAKLARADEIEGYDPSDEATSEYVRRQVWVTRLPQQSPTPASLAAAAADAAATAAACPSSERVLAWIYVKQAGVGETTTNATSSARIEHGDWMKRDRTRQHPAAAAGASP